MDDHLRDQFACYAMNALIVGWIGREASAKKVADVSYEYADAMLKARGEQDG